MNSHTPPLKKRPSGFALIEVLLAALILTVGGAAFMKLQRIGLQYNYNNYARTQGIVIAQGFIEQLRSNIAYVKNAAAIQDKVTAKAEDYKPNTAIDCSGTATTCANSIFAHQKYLISQQIATVTPNSVLCYSQGTARGHIRVTYLWQDNSKAGKATDIKNCPAFTEQTTQTNSVTIYAQL